MENTIKMDDLGVPLFSETSIRSRMVEIIDSIISVDRLNSGLTNHRLRRLDPGTIIFLILSQSNADKRVSFFTWKGISFKTVDVQVHVQVSHVTYKANESPIDITNCAQLLFRKWANP